MEDAGRALRIALPRRMKLRGGKSWTAFVGDAPERARVDAGLIDALQRAHLLATTWSHEERSDYRRRLRRLAFLSPAVQRMILDGRLPPGVGLAELLAAEPPLRWSEQEAWLQGLGLEA